MPSVLTPNSQVIVTDIDGDGVNEVIILESNLQQLSVVHQFEYSDITLNSISPTIWPTSMPGTTLPVWTTDDNTHWWTLWSAQQGLVPTPQGSVGWGIEGGDAIMAADLDGDGIDELFIYNLTYCWWGILKWEPNTNQLQTIYQVSVAPSNRVIPVGQLNWTAAAGDQYFVVPNLNGIIPAVPVKASGILAYNSENLTMGMISYSPTAGELLQWWKHYGSSLPGWNLDGSFPLPANNQFLVANFADQTAPSVVVYDPEDKYMALLKWNGSEFTTPPAQGGAAGNWRFDSADQIQWADLDGDGLAEILIYNPNTKFLGVLKWENGQCDSLAVTDGTISTTSYEWTIAGNENYYCVNNPGKPANIYAYSPDTLQVAVLIYQSGGFACQWSGDSLNPNNGWPVTANDSYYVGSPSDSASPTLFTVSNQGSIESPAMKLGAATWNGTELQINSNATIPVPAWSPAFLAAAPSTEFNAFQGVQADIYTYLSKLFPVPGQQNPTAPTSVRTIYSSSNYKDYFPSYSEALEGVSESPAKVPKDWPAPDSSWIAIEWKPVVDQIVLECTQVTAVYGLYHSLNSMAGTLHKFQGLDFGQVKLNISKAAQNNPSEIDYWIGQVFVAALWGLAASAALFLEGPVAPVCFGIFFSMVASFAGSAVGYDPTQRKSFEVEDMELQLKSTFDKSIITVDDDRTASLNDPVKLQICYGLLGNEWQMLDSLPDTIEPFSAKDRLLMYQQLMPFYFSISYGQTPLPPPLVPPPTLFAANGTSYALKASSYFTPAEFQDLDLYTDLFITLGVSQEDFFLGVGGWSNIPRTEY
jgi:hypothetical protein